MHPRSKTLQTKHLDSKWCVSRLRVCYERRWGFVYLRYRNTGHVTRLGEVLYSGLNDSALTHKILLQALKHAEFSQKKRIVQSGFDAFVFTMRNDT